MLILFILGTFSLVSSIPLVAYETSTKVGNGREVPDTIEDVNRATGIHTNGDNFGINTKIPGVEGSFAVVAIDDLGGVYIAYRSQWAENSIESESLHVYFAYSHDYGKTWSNSFRIDDNGSSSVFCDSPSITVDRNNGHIYVAWKDNRTGVANVYIDKFIDRGVSFGVDVKIYDWPDDYVPPWLPYTVNIEIGDNGIIHVTWIAYYSSSYTDRDIFFAYSKNGGHSFSTPIIINRMESDAIFAHPWIAIDGKNVLYVAYSKRNSTSSNVYLVKSQNGGSSFGTPVKVNDVSTQKYIGGTQVIVSPDGNIHVVWTDNRAGDGTQYLDIYYATSSDGGLSFGPNIRVNDDLVVSPPDMHPHFTRGAQGTPSIAADSDSMVHIVWEDFRNFVNDTTYCRDIYYASSESGTQFSTNIKVNYVHPDADSVNNADPNIAIDPQDNFFIVYSDAPSGDNNHHSIYFIFVPNMWEQLSETPSPTFGFQLIPMIIAFLVLIFFTRKKFNI
jgi:hypothetical protein